MGRAEELFNRAQNEGMAFMDNLIQSAQPEELFLDYKRVENENGSSLGVSDRKNLAKAISGFGNSAGGVIIWGVDCRNDPKRGDVPGDKHRITNPTRFQSWIENAVSGLTLPAHPGIQNHVIDDPSKPGEGFVVTLIPESSFAPHAAVIEGQSSDHYIRAGSNFSKIPHIVLAGMFGKRPLPSLQHSIDLNAVFPAVLPQLDPEQPFIKAQISLANTGRVIARDLYLNLRFELEDSTKMEFNIKPSGLPVDGHSEQWYIRRSSDHSAAYLVSKEYLKLAPAAKIASSYFKVVFRGATNCDWTFSMEYGCDGSSISEVRHKVSANDLRDALANFRSHYNTDAFASEKLTRLLLGVKSSDG